MATASTMWSLEARCNQLVRELESKPVTCKKVQEIAEEISGWIYLLQKRKGVHAELDQSKFSSDWAAVEAAVKICDKVQRAQSEKVS